MIQNYKADTPKNTIQRIRNILEQHGIVTDCITFGKAGMSHSARVTVKLSDHNLNIGTNGKGMTEEYAIASAYGELMERLCNKALIFATKYSSRLFRAKNSDLKILPYKPLDFRYFPDEQYRTISSAELCRWGNELLPNSIFYKDLHPDKLYDMPFLPFLDYCEGKEVLLPYDMIRLASGSTGLCAGNTKEEAILQGINEIFERFVLQRIYIEQPVLPTLKLEHFSDTEIGNRIESLERQTGWRFSIKDCSLGRGLPVIGLLIIDDYSGKYTFRLGADSSDEIALQRCFTEIFQGNNIDNSAFLNISVSENWEIKQEYEKNVLNGRGHYPNSIFIEDANSHDKYLKPHTGNSIESNLTNTIEWLQMHNYNLFIRDNSFMGFPVFQIFIPGLSDVNEKLSGIKDLLLDNYNHYKIADEYRLKRITKDEAKSVINKYRYNNSNKIPLFNYSLSPYNNINKDLLLSMLSYYVGNYSDAHKFLSDFLDSKLAIGQKQNAYYYCVRDFFSLKHKKYNDINIRNVLSTLYSTKIAEEVLNDMSDESRILQNFPIPDCFNCQNCSHRELCHYKSIIEFESKIQRIQIQFYN